MKILMRTHELPLPRHRLFVCWGRLPGRRLLNALALSLAGDMPVTSSHTSAFTHSPFLGCTKEGLLLGIYRSCDALPVPFFSTRALQCQRCEGHASSRGTGSVYQADRSLAGAPAAPKRMKPPSLGRTGLNVFDGHWLVRRHRAVRRFQRRRR